MTVKVWKFIINDTEQNLRLDQAITMHTGLSRRKVRAILQLGGVQVARKRTRIASKQLSLHEEVIVAYDSSLGIPKDIEIPVIFEDDWLLIIDKPAGIATQGTQASDKHDVMAMLSRQYPNYELKLQHRLDQGTSGILVIAKHHLANIGSQFQKNVIKKTYIARISGPISPCIVDMPIGRIINSSPSRYSCSGNLVNIKTACTNLTPFNHKTTELKPGFWVVAEPQTGRTHQIRVHLAHLGNPVYGDIFYCGEKSDQLWLHAWKLAFLHPITDLPIELVAPPIRFLNHQ